MTEQEATTEGKTKCENPANFSYVWPGAGKRYICIEHLTLLGNIAAHMGLTPGMIHVQLLTSENVLDILNWPDCEQITDLEIKSKQDGKQ